jgi:hypothetical protein
VCSPARQRETSQRVASHELPRACCRGCRRSRRPVPQACRAARRSRVGDGSCTKRVKMVRRWCEAIHPPARVSIFSQWVGRDAPPLTYPVTAVGRACRLLPQSAIIPAGATRKPSGLGAKQTAGLHPDLPSQAGPRKLRLPATGKPRSARSERRLSGRAGPLL